MDEQQRFVAVAYPRTMGAARRAFKRWHGRKREDAIQECLSKMWSQWKGLLDRGRDPEPLLPGLIKFAVLWVRYDRKVAGRARGIDVYDYRAGMMRHQLSGQGYASPTDRGDPNNGWIDWTVRSGDDPAALVAALDGAGLSVAEYAG